MIRKRKIWMKGEVAVLADNKARLSANWLWQITFGAS